MKKQNGNRFIDTENILMVARCGRLEGLMRKLKGLISTNL